MNSNFPSQPIRSRRVVLMTLLIALLMLAASVVTNEAAAVQDRSRSTTTDDSDKVDRAWLDRLDKLDRHLLDENIGFAPPAFTDDLQWFGMERTTWDKLRGRVVVLQSWTSGSMAGRKVPAQVQRVLKDVAADDVLVIALHTPDNAENIETYIERRPIDIPLVVDARGKFCDELGIYTRPTNVVIDRNGTVRYAGLKTAALGKAVEVLVAEEFDEDAVPIPRKQQASDSEARFPTFSGSVGSANDLRGQRAPDFHVDEWINGRPDAQGKVMVVDFWATWCGPCVAAIPHMNELAMQFSDDVVCVGISSEKRSDFDRGMRALARDGKTLQSFRYALALDPHRRMASAIGVRGIPHVVVISSDWIVRWQGHAAGLDQRTLGQIVEANKKLVGTDSRRYRWTK